MPRFALAAAAAVVFAVAANSSGYCAGPSAKGTIMALSETDNRAAIEAIVASEDASWTAGDAALFSKAVAPDIVFTNIFGLQIVGKAGFEAQHAHIFATIYKNTRLRQTIAHVRFVADGVAIVDSDCEVSGPTIPPPLRDADGDLHTKLLQVFVRHSGVWMVESFHNIRIVPAPGA